MAPRRSQMALPNRAERKAMLKEMEELQKNEQAKNVAGFQEYVARIRAMDELMDELGELDSWGLPKTLEAKDKAALLKAMEETALAGEKYLENVREEEKTNPAVKSGKGMPGMVAKLQGMLSRDYAAVKEYDPLGSPTSLPQLMEKARCRTIELGSEQIESLTGAQSSRIPMSILNEKGERRQGFLTKASTVEIRKNYTDCIDAAVESAVSEKGADALKGLLDTYRAQKKFGPDKSDEYVIAYMVNANFNKNKPLNDMNMRLFLVSYGVRPKDIGNAAIAKLVNGLKPLCNVQTAFNGIDHGLKDGERIDRRNSAMSSVAALFGRKDLIAPATDIKFRDAQGNTVEGTFMDYGKGLDLGGKDKNLFSHVADNPFEGSRKPGALLRSLADLQVIDFICGNLDRHGGNMVYQVDDDGKLIGVQGIDNDCCLGTAECGDKSNLRMPGLDNMGVISESMANKVMSTDPSMLRFALRGRGLTEEQLDHVALRLSKLQAAIVKGREHYKDKPLGKGAAYDEGFLRTVPDQDFAKLEIKQIQPSAPKKDADAQNAFEMVRTNITLQIRDARKEGIQYDPYGAAVMPHLKEIDTTEKAVAEKTDIKKFTDALSGATAMVNFNKNSKFKVADVDKLTHGTNGSAEFSRMVEAVKRLAQIQKNLRESQKEGKQLTSTEYTMQYRQIKDALQDVKETREAYIARKMGQRKAETEAALVGKGDYEKNRISYAKEVGKMLTKFEKNFGKIEEPEGLMKDVENIHARDEQIELDDRRRAVEMIKKLHEEKGLAEPVPVKRNTEPEIQSVSGGISLGL